MNMVLSAAEQAQLKADGFVALAPGTLPSDLIDALDADAASVLADWTKGTGRDAHPDYDRAVRFEVGSAVFEGCATTRRACQFGRLGQGPRQDEPDNWLYGRIARASRVAGLPGFAAAGAEPVRSLVMSALGGAPPILHEAAAECVYPGHSGSDLRVVHHTRRFTNDVIGAARRGEFVLQVLVYLTDVTADSGAPFVFPGTHARYLAINRIVATRAGRNPEADQIPASGLWQEILPDVPPPVVLAGQRGTVILLNSFLLRGRRPNRTFDRTMLAEFSAASSAHEQFGLQAEAADTAAPAPDLASTIRRVKRAGLVAAGWIYGKSRRRLIHPVVKRLRPPIGVNVGSGANWAHPQVMGLDFDAGTDIQYNLVSQKLPFADSSLEIVYSSHCLEHLTEADAREFFRESFRVLKPGGVLRITCPNLDKYFAAYESRDLSFFQWIYDKPVWRHDSQLRLIARSAAGLVVDKYTDEELHEMYHRLGGHGMLDRLTAEIAQVPAEHLANYPDGHKSWWSPSKLIGALDAIGFTSHESTQHGSRSPVLRGPRFDHNNPAVSLFVEGVK